MQLHPGCGKANVLEEVKNPHILLGEKEVTVYNTITLKGPIIQITVFSIGNL